MESPPSLPILGAVAIVVVSTLASFLLAERIAEWRSQDKAKQVKDKLKESNREVSVGIIGAGFGCLVLVKKCQEMGFKYHIYEKREQFGGTWFQNRWCASYVSRDEILDYILWVVHDILKISSDDVSLLTKVNKCTFSKEEGKWTLEAKNLQTGAFVKREHDFIISCVGQLSIPSFPPKIESTMRNFKGQQFHSSMWPTKLDLSGKRVAIIGTGCSAAQIGPEIAPQCKELVVFQRSAGYVIPQSRYDYSSITKWAFRTIPFVHRFYRLSLIAFQEFLYHMIVNSPPGEQKTLRHRAIVAALKQDMTRMTPPSLKEQLIPTYTFGCKRIIVSSRWLPMFNRENVKLYAGEVVSINANGVTLANGTSVDGIDVIVYATGFRATELLQGLDVEVKETSQSLHKTIWAEMAFAYAGSFVPGLPNFAMLCGPNTTTGHSSIVLFEEASAELLFALYAKMILDGKTMFEVDAKACEEYNQDEQAKLKDKVWMDQETHNWYRTDEGSNVMNYHGSYWEFWTFAKRVKFHHFQFG